MKLYLKAAAFSFGCVVGLFAIMWAIAYAVRYFKLPDAFFDLGICVVILLGSFFYIAVEHLKKKERGL